MHELEVNHDVFNGGGVLGRKDFFINCLKIGGLVIASYLIPFVAGFVHGKTGSIVGLGLFGFATIGLTYFNFINMYKRLRDIRGTTQNQVYAQVWTTIGMCLPIVSLFCMGWLCFKKGKITSKVIPPPATPQTEYQKAA